VQQKVEVGGQWTSTVIAGSYVIYGTGSYVIYGKSRDSQGGILRSELVKSLPFGGMTTKIARCARCHNRIEGG
jgi:hypothetical protein